VLGLALAVMTMSLLGGLHCTGMCGAFVALAVSPAGGLGGAGNAGWGFAARLQGAYHAGRLATYALLGAGAGALGAGVDLSAEVIGLQRAALVLSASVLVVFGVATLLRSVGVAVPRAPVPGFLRAWAEAGHRLAFRMDPMPRAVAIGLLTTLLPCGWLYVFVVTAAGTGHAGWGAVVMGAFWVGTLPWLAGVGAGVRMVAGPLGARLPTVTACVLIGAGLVTLSGRVPMVGMRVPSDGVTAAGEVPMEHCGPGAGVVRGAGGAGRGEGVVRGEGVTP
jgi:sulfite exporter TauE/SafE